MTGRVMVTGGSGFVGTAVIGWLARADLDVVSVVRRPGSTAGPFEERRITDPLDPQQWRIAGAGCTAAVHTIGRSHLGTDGDADAFRRVNVGITTALASGLPGLERLCYISSIKAVGEGAEMPYDEHSRCAPEDEYGRSKLAAERALLGSGLGERVVILRPPLVHGPGVRGNLRRLISAIERGIPLPLGAATAPRSTIATDALAEAVRITLASPDVPRIMHVADPEPLSVRQLIDMIGTALGRTPRLLRVPPPLLRAIARPVGATGAVDRLFGPLVVDPSLLQSLGWTPPRPLATTIGEAAVAHRDAERLR